MNISKFYNIFLNSKGISHDTRQLKPGSVYWAIRGENFDGNDFVVQAFEKGAAYAVIDNIESKINENCLVVPNTLAALQQLANHHRKELKVKVIAIAGSNGKTTTKELIKSVLEQKYNVLATPGNFNNHIGLPLSILQLQPSHDVAVLELGANKPGENAELCAIADPDYGLVTNTGKDHLEGFGSLEGVAKANAEVFDYLERKNGLIFLNADDAFLPALAEKLQSISYAAKEDVENCTQNFCGNIINRFPFLKINLIEKETQKSIEIDTKLFGKFHIYNILAAAAVGSYFGLQLKEIARGIENYTPANNRSQLLEKDTNIFIMDAYNANPSSMQLAIEEFGAFPMQNKILVLGDMLEMGAESAEEHRKMLEVSENYTFNEVWIVGPEFFKLKNEFKNYTYFSDSSSLKQHFQQNKKENTAFYLKASRGIKLEKMIED